MLEKIFKLKEKGTTVKTEVIAGITTFLAMAYILAVNPNMLSETGLSYDGVFLATALSSGIATLIMGLLANYPVALAPGMGVNALFTYTLVFSMGYSPAAALAAVVVCNSSTIKACDWSWNWIFYRLYWTKKCWNHYWKRINICGVREVD